MFNRYFNFSNNNNSKNSQTKKRNHDTAFNQSNNHNNERIVLGNIQSNPLNRNKPETSISNEKNEHNNSKKLKNEINKQTQLNDLLNYLKSKSNKAIYKYEIRENSYVLCLNCNAKLTYKFGADEHIKSKKHLRSLKTLDNILVIDLVQDDDEEKEANSQIITNESEQNSSVKIPSLKEDFKLSQVQFNNIYAFLDSYNKLSDSICKFNLYPNYVKCEKCQLQFTDMIDVNEHMKESDDMKKDKQKDKWLLMIIDEYFEWLVEYKFMSKEDEKVKQLTFDELRPKYDELNMHMVDYPKKDDIRKSIEDFYDMLYLKKPHCVPSSQQLLFAFHLHFFSGYHFKFKYFVLYYLNRNVSICFKSDGKRKGFYLEGEPFEREEKFRLSEQKTNNKNIESMQINYKPQTQNVINEIEKILHNNELIQSFDVQNFINEQFDQLKTQILMQEEQILQTIRKKREESLKKLDILKTIYLDNNVNVISRKSCNFQSEYKNIFASMTKSLKDNCDKTKLKNLDDMLHSFNKILANDSRVLVNCTIDDYKNKIMMNKTIFFKPRNISEQFYIGHLLECDINNYKILSSSCGKLLQTFDGHTNVVSSAQVDLESNLVISGSHDKTIKVWDMKDGQCLKTLTDHQNLVTSILINDKMFLSGSTDKTIKIWNKLSFECLNTLNNESEVHTMCSLPENKLACGDKDGFIHIWNLRLLTKIHKFRAHEQFISCLKLSSDSTMLISASNDKKINMFELDNNFTCVKSLVGHEDCIHDIDMISSHSLKIMRSVSKDGCVIIWDLSNFSSNTNTIAFTSKINSTIKSGKFLSENLIAISCDNSNENNLIIYDFNCELVIRNIVGYKNARLFQFIRSSTENRMLLSIGDSDTKIKICQF